MSDKGWSVYIQTPPSLSSAAANLSSSVKTSGNLQITDSEVEDLLGSFGMDEGKPKFLAVPNEPIGDFNIPENRSLVIINVNPTSTDEEINKVFGQYGGLAKVDKEKLPQGILIVTYYDLREAHTIKMKFNGMMFKDNIITINYAPISSIPNPKNKKAQNNGTIVIFHLANSVTDDHIKSIFMQYGEIRQIRSTPSKHSQRFVEYWDTRAAQKAMSHMNGRYVSGNRITIEFSQPGGVRKNPLKPSLPNVLPPVTIQRPK